MATQTAKFAARTTIKMGSQGLVTDEMLRDAEQTFSGVARGNFYDYIADFEDKFAEAVAAYVGDSGRLIVFIDDLARCLPENAITVLESLKLFLDKAPCVFVVGVDQAALSEAIRTTYGSEAILLGRDYLDKIVQVAYSVPLVDSGTAMDALQSEWENNPLTEASKQLAYAGIEGNPRRAKRFTYAYNLTAALANQLLTHDPSVEEIRTALLTFATICRLRFPNFADVCAANPQGLKTFYLMVVGAAGEHIGNEPEARSKLGVDGALDYLPHWGDTDLCAFLRRVDSIRIGPNPVTQAPSAEFIGTIFRLSRQPDIL